MEENITRTMTPFQSGNEYYKKMLDLQERLRRSEEERMRLEARFSLLEHESRSRHETCINRLRMRYIEFLEDQQSRDERNHQLLGALDRVDSSLALMSAKTDRLGILRKQYEASLLASYENRRPNGSVTGDSGVASQNDERQRRSDELSRGYRNDSVTLVNRDTIVGSGQASPNDRVKNSPSQRVRSGSSYTGNWSRIHCESSLIPSIAFSRFPQGHSVSNARDATVGNFENSKSFLQPKNSRDRRESSIQSFPYKNSQNSTIYDSRFARGDYPLLQNIESGNPATSLKYDRSVVRDLANSGAYETTKRVPKFFDASPGHHGDSNPRLATSRNSAENCPRGNSIFPSNSSWDERNFKPGSSSPKSPKFSDILKQELGDEEEYIGSMVENQLERYISKIRSLHRDADPQSLDEMDHEQNTSGDLLNVTLSDDEIDFPIEEKSRVRGLFSQELGNVMALADDLANQTCDIDATDENDKRISGTGVRLSGETLSSDDGKFIDEGSHAGVRNNVKSDAVQRVTSIDRRPRYSGETGTFEEPRNSEKIGLLAKNGITDDVTKPRAKLASRSARNIEDIAKLNGNSIERDLDDMESSRVSCNEMGHDESRISDRANVPETKYRLVSGEERETGENLCDITEDLEPWNISALERRVQEIILNDEAQNDFIARGGAKRSSRDDGSSRRTSDHVEQAVSGIYDEWDEPSRSNDPKADALIAENDQQPTETKDSWKNDESIGHEGTISHGEANGDSSSLMNEQNARLDEDKDVSSSNMAAESVDRLPQELRTKSDETENVGGIDDIVGNDDVEPSMENRERKGDDDSQYGNNADGEYQGDDGAQYQQYNLDNNGEQYGYVDQQYPNQYVEDPNQKYAVDSNQDYVQDNHEYPQNYEAEYVQNPNQAEYAQDPNQAEYVQDPNQAQYIQDPNQEEYAQNPNQAEYIQDSNQAEYIQDPNQAEYAQNSNQAEYAQNSDQAEYIQDSNQGEYEQDPDRAEYNQDPSQAEYVQDFNQGDYVQDPNQQYTTDPNLEYAADSNQQYGMNPNQEYSEDPNQQYAVDPNQQYPADSIQDYPVEHQQYTVDQNDPADPNLEYSTDPNQQYISESDHNQQYASESDHNQKYTSESGLNQQYTSESGLNQQSVLESDSDQQPLQEAVQDDNPRSQEGPVNDKSGENLDRNANDGKDDYQNGDNEVDQSASGSEINIPPTDKMKTRTTKDVIKSLLDSDTESTIERNVSNTESDFDFN